MLSCEVLSTPGSHFSRVLDRDCGEGWRARPPSPVSAFPPPSVCFHCDVLPRSGHSLCPAVRDPSCLPRQPR